MRRAAKVDANHTQIRNELRARGYSVIDMSKTGNGFPDLIVANSSNGKMLLVEIKTKGGRLTPKQVDFIKNWPLPNLIVVTTIEQIIIEIGDL